MSALLNMLAGWCALAAALIITPWCLAGWLRGTASPLARAALAAALGVVLNMAIPIAFHLTGIPILRLPLAAAHLLACSAAAVGLRLLHSPFPPPLRRPTPATLAVTAALVVFLLPWTPLGGIDTYKWLDLAQSVRMDRAVPWLVHPLSLAGFTPRSYPSAQPLLLGTIQVLGGFRADGGYALISLWNAAAGAATAAWFWQVWRGSSRGAACFAAFYVLSPVFMRYTQWATGRGVFLTILPLFIGCLLQRRLLPALATGLLLFTCHKTAVVAVPVLLAAAAVACLPWPAGLWLPRAALALSLAAGLLFAAPVGGGPAARVFGWLRYDVVRFAWMTPVLLAGWWWRGKDWSACYAARLVLLAAALFLPPAHHREMYAAMAALPLVAIGAADTLEFAARRNMRPWYALALALSLLCALGVVAVRNANDMPGRLVRAARFLEDYDPRGPFRVLSPAKASLLQGWLSGCPRYRVSPGMGRFRLAERPAIAWRDPLKAYPQIAGWLRNLARDPSIETSWYGDVARRYHFTLDAAPPGPASARLIYEQDGVRIYQEDIP